MDVSWRDGRALAGLIAKFRPDILDSLQILSLEDPIIRLNVSSYINRFYQLFCIIYIQAVFDAVNKYMGIPSPCKPEEWANLAKDAKLDYICKVQKINRKRSEPIEKLAQDLLGCSSFHVEDTISKILKKEVEKIVTGDLLKEQINNMYVDKDKKVM
uniref:Calponin-homology (CH) domain-containing protein n=1 Tax=Heterorhabditis bacteriophora TaxID=37862 RepID=A0A1I7WV80_HETBA